MIDGYKIITCGPVGRRKYFEIQLKYIKKLKGLIDKHIFWLNTLDQEDLKYFESIVKSDPEFFECIDLPHNPRWAQSTNNIHRFYEYCNDPNAIYCRIDDDIVYIEYKEFENFIKFRIQNPQYSLVFPNIINNGICFYLHQKFGLIDDKYFPPVEYSCSNRAWENYSYAIKSFSCLQQCGYEGRLDKLKFDKWILTNNERFSVNFFAWFGKDEDVRSCQVDEENWLTTVLPRIKQKHNCIYGKFLVAHYAFFTQREKLDEKTEIINFFKEISELV